MTSILPEPTPAEKARLSPTILWHPSFLWPTRGAFFAQVKLFWDGVCWETRKWWEISLEKARARGEAGCCNIIARTTRPMSGLRTSSVSPVLNEYRMALHSRRSPADTTTEVCESPQLLTQLPSSPDCHPA